MWRRLLIAAWLCCAASYSPAQQFTYAPAGSTSIKSGTSGSIGGAALLAGACAATSTVTVPGAVMGMVASITPAAYPGAGVIWQAAVTAANTVSVYVCVDVAATPTATTYNVRVIP